MSTPDVFILDLNGLRSGIEERCCVADDAFFRDYGTADVKGGDVRVRISISKDAEGCMVAFRLEGSVRVPCDRCLDLTDVRIDATRTLRIGVGDAFCDSEDAVTLDRRTPVYDMHGIIYEFIALEIPLTHVHAAGQCNEQMMQVLARHVVSDEEGGEPLSESGRVGNPCWDKLKGMINNNQNIE